MLRLEIFSKLLEHNNRKENDLPVFLESNGEPMKEDVKDFNEYIELNAKLDIGIKRGDYTGVYDSRVEDIQDDHILIAHPSEEGIPIPMLPGTGLNVEFVNTKGRFRFASKVIDRHIEGSLSMIKIEIPKTITRQQLREFYRVETRVKAKIKLYYAKVPDKNMKIPHKSVECTLVDISGGGGKLITEAWVDTNQHFGLDLSEAIENLDNIKCIAVRSKRIQEKTEVSFKFNFSKESERNPIIKYVFKRQIELKQMLG
jgi:c-di-GMP-binding flagellar brake protein YcgR